MMRMTAMPVRAIAGILALAAVATFVLDVDSAGAQTPDNEGKSTQGDMWYPGWMQRHMWGPGPLREGMRLRAARHQAFIHQGVPSDYHDALNPLSPDEKTIGEGRALYRQKCGSCHGKTGMGDGEGARSLSPSPALLAYMIQMPMAIDGYMLWTISEGGAAFGTAMPAFKAVLSKTEIWKIVTYMRAGFPEDKPR